MHYYKVVDRKGLQKDRVTEKLSKRYAVYNRLSGQKSSADIDKDILTAEFAVHCPTCFKHVALGVSKYMTRSEAIERYIFFYKQLQGNIEYKDFKKINICVQDLLGYLKETDSKDPAAANTKNAKNLKNIRPKSVEELEKLVSDIIKHYKPD